MYCRYCGKEIPNDSKYCSNCGASLNEFRHAHKVSMPKFIGNHKIMCCVYFVWLLMHITIFFFSSPKGFKYVRYIREDYDLSDAFYPFNKPLGNILNGENYNCSFIENIDVYDQSELFFYTILIPIMIFGLIRILSYIFTFLKKIKRNQHQKTNVNIEEEIESKQQDSMKKETESYISKVIVTDTKIQSQKELKQDDLVNTDNTIKEMPLLSRFIGSFIDKIIILIIFALGVIIISPYDAPERLGAYIGVSLFSSNSYGYYEELDMIISFAFILWNVIYFVAFESILFASPGKWMLGGVIIDSADEKISFEKAMTRGVCAGALMIGLYLLHLQGIFAIILVIILYFLILDIPIFFKKKSLLDICTGTIYAKRDSIWCDIKRIIHRG